MGFNNLYHFLLIIKIEIMINTILTSQLPSGGVGYAFPTISVSPFTFLDLTQYLENLPSDPLSRYMYDIKVLMAEDKNIYDCYAMDLDFLIFYKKLCTVSEDLTYNLTIKCPDCGTTIKKKIALDGDIHFKQIESEVMGGAVIELNGHKYETIVPTVRDFLRVFDKYLRGRRVNDLNLIKTVALIKDFEVEPNQVERDVLNATHNDITLLLALRELYYDRVEPITVYCPECNKDLKGEERRGISVSVNSLIGDFFRELCNNSPIDGTKILFK